MFSRLTQSVLVGCAVSLMPASALAAGIAFSTDITNGAGINHAAYASGSGFSGFSPGLVTNFDDPTAVLVTSPASMPLGLNGANMLLTTGDGSMANVFGSLASGAVHTKVNAATPGSIAVAEGVLQDTLTFHVAGGGSANIDFDLSLDGSFAGGTYIHDVNVGFGSAAFGWEAFFTSGPQFFGPTGTNFGWTSQSLTNDSFTSFNFDGSVTVTDGEQLALTLTDRLECRNSTACDFSHTLQTGLDLSPGVSFTSESGEFLTAAAAPEPASMLLIGCGIAALALVRRRR